MIRRRNPRAARMGRTQRRVAGLQLSEDPTAYATGGRNTCITRPPYVVRTRVCGVVCDCVCESCVSVCLCEYECVRAGWVYSGNDSPAPLLNGFHTCHRCLRLRAIKRYGLEVSKTSRKGGRDSPAVEPET